jgi:DNA-binding MarR family transcriptional regulator
MTTAHPPVSACTCFRLRKLARTTSRFYDQHMARVGLKTTQYSLLKNIADASRPVAELAALLATERTTLTRNLKPLIESGWVTLEPGRDARQRVVTITAAGRDKVREARRAWRTAQDNMEHIIGADRVQALHAQIDAVFNLVNPHVEDQNHEPASTD